MNFEAGNCKKEVILKGMEMPITPDRQPIQIERPAFSEIEYIAHEIQFHFIPHIL